MNPLLSAADEIQTYCDAQGWDFCFIGGIAVQRWGEPRLTLDVDVTITTGFGSEGPFIDALLEDFEPRGEDAADFARRHRVVLLRATGGSPIDVSLGALPFEARAVERASDFEIGDDIVITTCSAEDLIVFKAFAGRDRDWLDIGGVATRQGPALDMQLIWSELEPLLELKGDQQAAGRLRGILA